MESIPDHLRSAPPARMRRPPAVIAARLATVTGTAYLPDGETATVALARDAPWEDA